MGLPGVSIPSGVYPNIQSALEACSAKVDVLAVSDQDVRIGLLAAFKCNNQEGDVVLVRVHKAKHISPDGIIAILEPRTRRFCVSRRHGRYLDEVQASLIRQGALRVRDLREGTQGDGESGWPKL